METVVYNTYWEGRLKIFTFGLSPCSPHSVFQIYIRTPPGKTSHFMRKYYSGFSSGQIITMKSETYSNKKEKPGRMLSGRMVFHTKYNRPTLDKEIQKRAREIIRNVLLDLDCEVIKIIVQPNYVFLQFRYSPNLAMSRIANKVKGISSCLLRREFPELKKQNPKALWAPKYGVYP